MTCIIGVIQSEPARAVHLAADSRAVDQAGNRFTIPKVLPIPTLGAALAVMGTTDSLPFLAFEICKRASNFADAVDALPEAMRAMQAIRATAGDQSAQLVVLVGFNDVTPEIRVCSTSAEAGIEPWVVHDGGTFFATPMTLEVRDKMGLPNDTDRLRLGDVPGYMSTIKGALPDTHRHRIGGPVTVTSVFRDRIEQRVVGVVPEGASVPRRGLRVFGF